MRFFDWSEPDGQPVTYDMADGRQWDVLLDRYTDGRGNKALERIFEILRSHKVLSVLIETRYIDGDWRSEHARFYSTTFSRYASIAHRLHFFAAPIPADLGDLSAISSAYRGYTVLRPLPSQPVGRTMVTPPPELDAAMRCEAVESVDVLGWPMTVRSMPFISQDAQYLRCAHADLWMTLRHAFLRHQIGRKLPSDIHDATMGGVIAGRQVPSDGLSIQQMLAGMNALGLSPATLPLPKTAAERATSDILSLFGIMCRYVNSNIAPIVASQEHVWLIVAYTRERSAAHSGLTLYRHDDANGPFLKVDDPWNEAWSAHRPWSQVLLPLPPKIYMTAEYAEEVGRWWFGLRAQGGDSGLNSLAEMRNNGKLSFMIYGVDSSRYKFGLTNRSHFDSDVAREYRLSSWPRNLWVVEAINRQRRDVGDPCVVGEVIIDPTANHYPSEAEPGIIAAHAPGLLWLRSPDRGIEQELEVSREAYESGRPKYVTT